MIHEEMLKMKVSHFIVLFLVSICLHGQNFVDISDLTGEQNLTQGEGIAIADFNNDGLEDFYICHPAGRNSLYQNQGDGVFVEVSAIYGLDIQSRSKTAAWGDFNNDGYKDLYIGNQEMSDQLFLNVNGEKFQDISEAAGVYNSKMTQCVNLADVNNDGFLDMYISNFGDENILFINNGDLTFSNYIYLYGPLDAGKSMGGIFFDYDRDGDQDLYLSHDNFEKNILYQNDGLGRFQNIAGSKGLDIETYGMGVEILDVNLDGNPDVYVTNLSINSLLVNDGNGNYVDRAEEFNADDPGMSWGTIVFDYDSDGRQDIYVANDFSFAPTKSALLNKSDDIFVSKEEELAIANEESNFGVGYSDFDNDGDSDLIITNKSSYSRIIRNDCPQGNFVNIKLVGTTSNRDAIGANVKWVDASSNAHYREVRAGNGWTSQSSSILHFGLADFNSTFVGEINWPSGHIQEIELETLNKTYTVFEHGEIKEGIHFLESTTTGIFSEHQFEGFNIFPNPSQHYFSLSSPHKLENVQVYTLTGQILTTEVSYTNDFKSAIISWPDHLNLTHSLFLVHFQVNAENHSRIVYRKVPR